MPKRLSIAVRNTIRTLFQRSKWSIAKISNHLNIKHATVKRWVNRKDMSDKPRNCKPVSDLQQRMFKKDIKRGLTIRQTAKNHGYSYSFVYKKIRRSQKNKSGLYPYKALKKLKLNKNQKAKRLDYIKNLPYSDGKKLLQALKKKVYYDEKSFELGTPPNKQNVRFWSEDGKESRREFFNDAYPTRIHVMAGINWSGKSNLYWYLKQTQKQKGKNKGEIKFEHLPMNADTTIKAFEEIMIPFKQQLEQKHPNITFEYDGDNAKPHISKKFRNFLQENKIKHTPFGGSPINEKGGRPPSSPDICPIEYVFHDWSNNVMKRKPLTVQQLKKYAEEEWGKITTEEIQKKIKHMIKVMQWVVANNGDEYNL